MTQLEAQILKVMIQLEAQILKDNLDDNMTTLERMTGLSGRLSPLKIQKVC